MTTAYLAPSPIQKFWDNNGQPLAYGLVSTYAAGTTTPIATYTDSTGASQNTNPIVLNARGECGIWLLPNVGYKIAVTDANGNAIPGYPVDNIINNQAVAFAVKLAGTQRASTITSTADPDLAIAIAAGGAYSIEIWLNDQGGTSAGGLRGGIDFSGTFTSGLWGMNGNGTGVVPAPLAGIGFVNAQLESAQNGVANMFLTGGLIATTAGTISFKWAQHSSNVTPSIVGINSWMRVTAV